MCTLAVFRDVSSRWPLVVAANRDELYARRSIAPARLAEDRSVVAGKDQLAGGTWLGARVDVPFLFSAVHNRRARGQDAPSGPGELSRGRLCLDALVGGSGLEEALDSIGALDLARYGPFTLLLADAERSVAIDNADGFRVTELRSELSVLTNLEVGDPNCPRLANAVLSFQRASARLGGADRFDQVVGSLAGVLGDHANRIDSEDPSPLARLCVHTERFGTKSSSIVGLQSDGAVRFFHAEGPPCSTPFEEVLLA